MTNNNQLVPVSPDNKQSGKAGWALAWLLGIPLPVLLVIYAISRC